jgi:penicillin-binding protein 2
MVGYVGPVSDFDLSRLMTATHCCKSRFQIGKTMVENRLERDLRGSAGTAVEVNAAGRVVRRVDRVEAATPGGDVH